jgi:hypothetical protein
MRESQRSNTAELLPQEENVERMHLAEHSELSAGAPPVPMEALIARVTRAYGAFGAWRPGIALQGADEPRDAVSVRRAVAVLGLVFAASLALSLVSKPEWAAPGEWSTAFRPDMLLILVWAPALFWAMTRWLLHRAVYTYLGLSLFIDSFSEVMMVSKGGGYWDSVMWPASVAWFGTLKELTGFPGASVSTFTLVTFLLLVRGRRWNPGPEGLPLARLTSERWILLGCTLAVLWGIGLARGGSVIAAFRQTQHLLQLPWIGLVVASVLRAPRDLRAMGQLFLVTALLRSLLIAWIYVGVCVRNGVTDIPGHPEWCTTHSDTVLLVTAIGILFAHAMERDRKTGVLTGLLIGAVLVAALILNNRRLAFVSLPLMILVMWMVVAKSARKRRLTWWLGIGGGLLALYVAMGAAIPSGSVIFRPAKSIASVIDQHDNSSVSRDIENANLVFSLSKNPILPRGFGHEYDFSPESPPVDLSDVFASYRLVAHNGVLWLWSVGGVFGFTLVWLFFPITMTLSLRAYKTAETALERTGALSSLGAALVCMVQVWGDQGFSSYLTMVTLSVAFAVAAWLAVRGESRASWRLCAVES